MATNPAVEQIATRCCVVGGGPAGMMLGYLLGRAGVEIVVLEKHADFLRDFRGDTIHPSTLQVLHELGLLDSFLKRPHQEMRQVGAQVGEFNVMVADFSHLPTICKFIVFMPQWDFLDFLAESGRAFPRLRVLMQTEATDLIQEGERIRGVRATTPRGTLEVGADLVVCADGRHSVMREKAGLEVMVLGAPIDVLWMRISRNAASDPGQSLGHANTGRFLAMINRDQYWQCAYVIPKGGIDEVRAKGIERFRENIVAIAPFLSDRVHELKDWNDIKLLSVAVDRLRQWYRPGLLCIGDCAHAMSPIGGVGINLAIQDAVAAGNILAPVLREGDASTEVLRRVQERRMFPTRATQRLQILAQDNILAPALRNTGPIQSLPLTLKLFGWWPFLRRIPARVIGMGFRPEHVRAPAVEPDSATLAAHA